jgi:hypothetical protein
MPSSVQGLTPPVNGGAGAMSCAVCVEGGGSMKAVVATAAVAAALMGSGGSGNHGCGGSCGDNGSSGKWR